MNRAVVLDGDVAARLVDAVNLESPDAAVHPSGFSTTMRYSVREVL
jgi:hypothetical protein